MRRKFAVIVNPVAGRGRTIKRLPFLKTLTDRSDHNFDFYYTEKPYHAALIADRITREYDAVVAYGGDGTANEVMNGLAGSPTPFGIIPEGTGNDFSRSLNIRKNFTQSMDVLDSFDTRLIDLGTIGERVFLNGVGIGFDGFVNYRSRNVKLFTGSLSYFYAILTSMTLWRAVPIYLEIDGKAVGNIKAFLLAIGNGWSVGGGLKLTPDANLHDSVFDICHVRDIPIGKIILNIVRLKKGTLNKVNEVTMRRGQHIRIKSKSGLPVHYDGELYLSDTRELQISIVPRAAFVIGNWASQA